MAVSIFTQEVEISELLSRLSDLVTKRYHKVAEMEAEEIADTLFDTMGAELVCSDIDDAISEADDYIWEKADTDTTYTLDNDLLYLVDPYPENKEVDLDLVNDIACSECKSRGDVLTKAVGAYALELWRVAIREKLREVLEKRCSELGLL